MAFRRRLNALGRRCRAPSRETNSGQWVKAAMTRRPAGLRRGDNWIKSSVKVARRVKVSQKDILPKSVDEERSVLDSLLTQQQASGGPGRNVGTQRLIVEQRLNFLKRGG
jgi:hypothetical protein